MGLLARAEVDSVGRLGVNLFFGQVFPRLRVRQQIPPSPWQANHDGAAQGLEPGVRQWAVE